MADSYMDDPEDVEPLSEDDPVEDRRPGQSRGQSKILRAAFVVAIVVAGVWAYNAFLADGGATLTSRTGGQAARSVYYDLDEILVNLNTGERQARYLRVRIALELPNQAAVNAIKGNMPRVIDQFQIYMRELSPEDLNGAARMFRLKEELLRRVNAAVAPVEVHDVLFKELLVQ
jgi:flagellar FliL protein